MEERNRQLEAKLLEAQQELVRKERTIRTFKQTNKNYQNQLKKYQTRRAQQKTNTKDSAKVLELSKQCQIASKQIEKLKQKNTFLQKSKLESEKLASALQKQLTLAKENNDKQQYMIQEIKAKLKSQKMKNDSISKQSESKISNLQKQMDKAKKRISQLQPSKPSRLILEEKNFENQTDDIQTILSSSQGNPENLEFIEKVDLNLQVWEERYVMVPHTHKHFFKMFDRYLEKLMPSFKLSFLNMMTSYSEFKIEELIEYVEGMMHQ